jgi:thiamine monophosphate synthase
VATPTDSTPTDPTAGLSAHERAHEKLLAGRVTAVTVRNQMDTQAEVLRAQLAITEAHKAHAIHLIEQLDAKLAREHPAVYEVLLEEPEVRARRRSGS